MRKGLIICGFIVVFYLLEFFIYNIFGRDFTPSLLLLLVMFFNLYLGIRYSLFTAVAAGFLEDSFSPHLFGINLFSFVACAYMTTFLKSIVYHMGSNFSRLILISLVCLIYVVVSFVLYAMFMKVNLREALLYVLLPQVLITLLVANPVFALLKKCVLKLSV